MLKIVLLSLILSIQSFAQGVPSVSVQKKHVTSFSELRSFIQENKFSRIEDLLAQLSPETLKHYSLIHDSRSTHGSSTVEPRAMVYSDDGKMVMTFNGSNEQRNFNRLEVIQFNDEKQTFDFFDIAFSENEPQADPIFSEVNPKRCLGCHGINPRINWDDSPVWVGSYGEFNDLVNPTSDEGKKLAEYIAISAGKGRYQYLPRDPRSSMAPYNDGSLAGAQWRPNTYFTELTNRLNVKRLAKMLEDTPLYQQNKKDLWFVYLCADRDVEFTKAAEERLRLANLSGEFVDALQTMMESWNLRKFEITPAFMKSIPYFWMYGDGNQISISELIETQLFKNFLNTKGWTPEYLRPVGLMEKAQLANQQVLFREFYKGAEYQIEKADSIGTAMDINMAKKSCDKFLEN